MSEDYYKGRVVAQMSTEFRSVASKDVISNPNRDHLRQMARHQERTTRHGSAVYITKVRSRSAKNTFVVPAGYEPGIGQQVISKDTARDLAFRVQEYLKDRKVIRLDRDMGQHPNSTYHCRLYITQDFARIPYMWMSTLYDPSEPDSRPDFVSIYVPEWPERIIFAHPEEGTTYILGTDYFGECKKSFLRMAMYAAKKEGGLGLHAGSKVLRLRTESGLQDTGFILFGLSGTGKTTLTMHDHYLEGEEQAIIRQDDVVLMAPNGRCLGTESGFFIKTEGLTPSQTILYQAATGADAIFENVAVDSEGNLDFADVSLTSNGRGVIARDTVPLTAQNIDLDKASKVVFITRRKDVIPPVARLSPYQAAAFFMLGESIETSAGDPTRAGQSIREVGTNPFVVGPEAEEGNRLLRIVLDNPDMECYLLNTGAVGVSAKSAGADITVEVSTAILEQIARGQIEWTRDPFWGYEVATSVPGVHMSIYDPRQYLGSDEYRRRNENLRLERQEWLARYPDLDPGISESIGCSP